jgi:4-diphosphocytidyl-2C-methyl-D-erythritol kinase
VYAAWDRLCGARSQPAISIAEVNASLQRSAPVTMEQLHNDLEPAAHAASPALAEFAARLRGLGLAEFRMSGSGATYFTLADDEAAAHALAAGVGAALRVRTEVAALAVV